MKSATTEGIGLSIETSGTYGSVAIGVGGSVLHVFEFPTPRAHAGDFLPAIDRLFSVAKRRPQEIQDVYVSIGPGSFTGLRIGVTVARMIAFATGARVTPVPTLEVMAQNALQDSRRPDSVAVILDAKRKRVYASSFHYESGRFECRSQPAEVEPTTFLAEQSSDCAVLGEGVAAHRAAVDVSGLRVLSDSMFRARAEVVFELGFEMAKCQTASDWRVLVPNYVRLPEAEERWAKRHTT